MGNFLQVFHPITITLESHNKPVPEETKKHIRVIFDALRAKPDGGRNEASIACILRKIPKNDNILAVLDSEGYNLLQKTVGINNMEMVRWILGRSPDLNRGACSLPLHIACLRGFEELVQLLLKNGARTDAVGRMCWPQPHHNPNCVERGKHIGQQEDSNRDPNSSRHPHNRCSDKLQNSIYYAIDGDQPTILDILTQRGDEKEGTWLSWSQKRPPLLHVACERGAWNCVQYLVNERADEINYCFDEYFPIHQAVLHDVKFVRALLNAGANSTVKTATQQLTCLHVLFLNSKKSAEDVLVTTKLLLEHGLKDLINEADSLGNTPLHALIVRYALEESRVGMYQEYVPWSKWDMMRLVLFLLQQGARPSINQPGNSALAGVLRHVRDWEFRYELLSMLLAEGGNPNVVGRDGSVPLMVCLVPLIKPRSSRHVSMLGHNMPKVFYLNCVRTLLKHGANPNCSSRTNLTPLHIIMFAAGEYMGLTQSEEKDSNFAFLRQLLVVLLQFGLDPNVRFSSRTQHILLSLLEMVMSARMPEDLDYLYDMSLTLIQYGANPNVNICSTEPMIIQSQSSFFLKKSSNKILYYYIQWLCSREHLLLDPQRRFARIIYLYVMCMDHRELYNCIKLVYTQSAVVPTRDAYRILGTTLKAIHTTPRSLRQQARYVIYTRLVRNKALPTKLQLPSPVIKYLMFELI